ESARAESRSQAVIDANDFISGCVAAGGSPDILDDSADKITVWCVFGLNSDVMCGFWPETWCEWSGRTEPPQRLWSGLGVVVQHAVGNLAGPDPNPGAGAALRTDGSQVQPTDGSQSHHRGHLHHKGKHSKP